MHSLEHICRELIAVAVRDGLVMTEGAVEELSAGDLVGMSNRLGELLHSTTLALSTGTASMPEVWHKEEWKVAEHHPLAEGEVTVTFRDGEMYINGIKVIERRSLEQKQGGQIKGEKLHAKLVSLPNLPDSILDLLIREQGDEEVAKFLARFEGIHPFFWGTIYESPRGDRCVRCLCRRSNGRFGWSRHWLDCDWERHDPTLVLEHPLD